MRWAHASRPMIVPNSTGFGCHPATTFGSPRGVDSKVSSCPISGSKHSQGSSHQIV